MRRRAVWLLALCLLVSADAARAVIVTLAFGGVWDDGAGTRFDGTLTYDTKAQRLEQARGRSVWLHDPPYDPRIGLDIFLPPQDRGSLVISARTCLHNDDFGFSVAISDEVDRDTLPASGSSAPYSGAPWTVSYVDSSGSAFPGGQLPTSLSLDDLDSAFLSWRVPIGLGPDIFAIRIDTLRTVPEPSTATLLGAGLAMLCVARRRGTRRAVADRPL